MTKLVSYDASRRNEAVQMVAEFFADHFSISEYTNAVITPERLQAADEDFDDWFEKDAATLFFIEDEDITVGFIFLTKHGGNVVWIENLYVKKEFRRKGIATRAIYLAEQYAVEIMNAPAINMDVIPQNIDALRLYHSLGYDTLQMLTVRKHLNGDRRDNSTDVLGFEFKI